MQDFDYLIGTMPFSVRAKRSGGELHVGISVERDRASWTEALADRSIAVDPSTLLASLVSNWARIAGPYAGFHLRDASLDLATLAGQSAEGRIVLIRNGHEIAFDFGNDTRSLGSESVIPVEVLLALGNLLAKDAPSHLKAMWLRASSPTDLPAFPLSRIDDMATPEDCRDEETDWYARALGHDGADYRRAARWLHARQLAFAVGHAGFTEPTMDEYDVRKLPDGIPDDDAIDAIYALSSEKLGTPVEQHKRDAVSGRNSYAREVTVFERFFPGRLETADRQ